MNVAKWSKAMKAFWLISTLAIEVSVAHLARALEATAAPEAPSVLPGKGLAQHDFFFAGEAKEERMVIVRNGAVVWSYTQAIEVTPNKKVVWALRSWTPPADLGPATTIQVLDVNPR